MKTDKVNDKQLTKQFWSQYAELCLTCNKKCRQSHKVKILSCKNYEKKV